MRQLVTSRWRRPWDKGAGPRSRDRDDVTNDVLGHNTQVLLAAAVSFAQCLPAPSVDSFVESFVTSRLVLGWNCAGASFLVSLAVRWVSTKTLSTVFLCLLLAWTMKSSIRLSVLVLFFQVASTFVLATDQVTNCLQSLLCREINCWTFITSAECRWAGRRPRPIISHFSFSNEIHLFRPLLIDNERFSVPFPPQISITFHVHSSHHCLDQLPVNFKTFQNNVKVNFHFVKQNFYQFLVLLINHHLNTLIFESTKSNFCKYFPFYLTISSQFLLFTIIFLKNFYCFGYWQNLSKIWTDFCSSMITSKLWTFLIIL